MGVLQYGPVLELLSTDNAVIIISEMIKRRKHRSGLVIPYAPPLGLSLGGSLPVCIHSLLYYNMRKALLGVSSVSGWDVFCHLLSGPVIPDGASFLFNLLHQ